MAAKVSSGRKSAHSGWNLCIISWSSILILRAPDAISGMPVLSAYWNVIMRLSSLIVQVLVRRIRNNHSPKVAGENLFAAHPFGDGSGQLSDYLDGLSE